MTSTKSFWIALCLMTLIAGGAAAQEAYVTGAGGGTNWRLDCGPDGCKRNTSAWRVGAGYRFNSVVAVEGFHIDFGRARSSDPSIDGDLGAKAFGVQALVGWQGGDFELNGKIGLSKMRARFDAGPGSPHASSTVSKNEVIGGLMTAWRVAPNLALRLDVDIATVALDGDVIRYSRGSDVVSTVVGLMLKF